MKGVAEAIKELDPEAATNPLLFPPADVVAKQHPQPDWDEATESRRQRAVRRPGRRLDRDRCWSHEEREGA